MTKKTLEDSSWGEELEHENEKLNEIHSRAFREGYERGASGAPCRRMPLPVDLRKTPKTPEEVEYCSYHTGYSSGEIARVLRAKK